MFYTDDCMNYIFETFHYISYEYVLYKQQYK